MNEFILDELGIERWQKRPVVELSEAMLIIMKKDELTQEKKAIFLKKILQAVHLQHVELMFATVIPEGMCIPPQVRLVWFLGEVPTPVSKPMVVSPALAQLMQTGEAKKKLYYALCDAIAV